MIKQKFLALVWEQLFNYIKVDFMHNIQLKFLSAFVCIFIQIFNSGILFAQDENQTGREQVNIPNNFGIAVINMQVILSQSTAAIEVRANVEKLQNQYGDQIKKEEEQLRIQQENLQSQRSIMSAEAFSEAEASFRKNVDSLQKKVAEFNRKLEEMMSTGIQSVQKVAIRRLTEIARDEGYAIIMDTSAVVIAAEQINLTQKVIEKLNATLPSIKNLNETKENDQ